MNHARRQPMAPGLRTKFAIYGEAPKKVISISTHAVWNSGSKYTEFRAQQSRKEREKEKKKKKKIVNSYDPSFSLRNYYIRGLLANNSFIIK